MPPTITKDHPTNGTITEAELAETTHARELAGGGEGPPRSRDDSRVSFALFASFMAVLLALAALVAVAFKLDDNQTSPTMMRSGTPSASPATPTQAATPAPVGHSLKVGMGDYFFKPQSATVSAGKVKVSAINNGQLPHEMVLAKTNLDPSQLPTTADGSVNEENLNSPGEVPDVAAGQTKHGTIPLTPGNYVMFCNLPGHYAAGMYGTLTVK
jgi:uncharacterized cupredoxin-like copper-binding protein